MMVCLAFYGKSRCLSSPILRVAVFSAEFLRVTAPPPAAPSMKLPRPLTSSAFLLRALQRRAARLGTDLTLGQHAAAAPADVSRRWHLPPAFRSGSAHLPPTPPWRSAGGPAGSLAENATLRVTVSRIAVFFLVFRW